MAFDGIDYRESALILPATYHPEAPLTGPALGGSLRLAYSYARTHSQRIIDQTVGQNRRAMSAHAFAAATWVALAEGYRAIPLQATHVVAEVQYRVLVPTTATVAHLRVKVHDGSTTATGTATDATVEPGGAIRAIADTFSPHAYDLVVRAEVELAALTLGSTCKVTIEGYAVNGASAAAFSLELAGAWAEVRG